MGGIREGVNRKKSMGCWRREGKPSLRISGTQNKLKGNGVLANRQERTGGNLIKPSIDLEERRRKKREEGESRTYELICGKRPSTGQNEVEKTRHVLAKNKRAYRILNHLDGKRIGAEAAENRQVNDWSSQSKRQLTKESGAIAPREAVLPQVWRQMSERRGGEQRKCKKIGQK